MHSLEKKGLTTLANRVKCWFNETSGAGVDFQYKFTGQDSTLFLKNFMHHCCFEKVFRLSSSDIFTTCLCLQAKAFFSTVTPTTWTFGHIIPAHAQDVFEKYSLGLNSVSMEGREAKHIAISHYSQNTNFHGRWAQIFCYEFFQLIWLRAKGFFVEETMLTRKLIFHWAFQVEKPVSVGLIYPKIIRSAFIACINTRKK